MNNHLSQEDYQATIKKLGGVEKAREFSLGFWGTRIAKSSLNKYLMDILKECSEEYSQTFSDLKRLRQKYGKPEDMLLFEFSLIELAIKGIPVQYELGEDFNSQRRLILSNFGMLMPQQKDQRDYEFDLYDFATCLLDDVSHSKDLRKFDLNNGGQLLDYEHLLWFILQQNLIPKAWAKFRVVFLGALYMVVGDNDNKIVIPCIEYYEKENFWSLKMLGLENLISGRYPFKNIRVAALNPGVSELSEKSLIQRFGSVDLLRLFLENQDEINCGDELKPGDSCKMFARNPSSSDRGGERFDLLFPHIKLYFPQRHLFKDVLIKNIIQELEMQGKTPLNSSWIRYFLSHEEMIPDQWKGKSLLFVGDKYEDAWGNILVPRLIYHNNSWCYMMICVEQEIDIGYPILILD